MPPTDYQQAINYMYKSLNTDKILDLTKLHLYMCMHNNCFQGDVSETQFSILS